MTRSADADASPSGMVVSVHRSESHTFTKPRCDAVNLVAGMGVDGDAHFGALVKHRSRVRIDPDQPNLRQVHLIHSELLDELADRGYAVAPGDLGENITTRGIDLMNLPVGATLRIGDDALIAITGLRNPCAQIDGFNPGLLEEVVTRYEDGSQVRKAGVMAVVVQSGVVRPGDRAVVSLPPPPHARLERV